MEILDILNQATEDCYNYYGDSSNINMIYLYLQKNIQESNLEQADEMLDVLNRLNAENDKDKFAGCYFDIIFQYNSIIQGENDMDAIQEFTEYV